VVNRPCKQFGSSEPNNNNKPSKHRSLNNYRRERKTYRKQTLVEAKTHWPQCLVKARVQAGKVPQAERQACDVYH
jgi:hypothetical protein